MGRVSNGQGELAGEEAKGLSHRELAEARSRK